MPEKINEPAAYHFGSYGAAVGIIKRYAEEVKESTLFTRPECNMILTVLNRIMTRIAVAANEEQDSFEREYASEIAEASDEAEHEAEKLNHMLEDIDGRKK